MPVRNLQHTKHHLKSKKKSTPFSGKLKYLLYFPLLACLVFAVYIFVLPSKYWDGKTRLALAVSKKDGNTEVAVFDPQTSSVTVLVIPQNTEVDVARNLGVWKMGSVEQLSRNEKLQGKLVSETVTKSFNLPTEAWSEAGGSGFYTNKPFAVWGAMFGNYKTNLNLKDRVLMGFFAMGVNSTHKGTTNLTETGFLVKAKLSDGAEGYKLAKTKPSRILAIFGDAEVSRENLGVAILYPRAKMQEAQKLGEVIQVLGAKVTSLEPNTNTNDTDCKIVAAPSITREKIADVFNCKTETSKENSEVVTIHVGDSFFKRF